MQINATQKRPTLLFILILLIGATVSCRDDQVSKNNVIIKSSAKMNNAVTIQMQELINQLDDSTNKIFDQKIMNPYAIQQMISRDYTPIFSNKKEFTAHATAMQQFLKDDAKYFGLFPASYHQAQINQMVEVLSKKDTTKHNAIQWAKAEIIFTDALFQIAKHIKNGRLYIDTNYKHHDSSLFNLVLQPLHKKFKQAPTSLTTLLNELEPDFADYDSLKNYLRQLIDHPEMIKKYTQLEFNLKDSIAFYAKFLARIQEEGFAKNMQQLDSATLSSIVKEYQLAHDLKETGLITQELIDKMNKKSTASLSRIILTLDKFKAKKINNEGNYVLVNIPAYTLRGFKNNLAQIESKVAVGKLASKTPTMESEISEIIIMPQWIVPPSILKLPGYIERHRKNKNFKVVGNRVIQKSGPGNALGNMKFNFKSGNAIYLHDTNEKWAFGSSKRAVSHGCVRVQDYVKLASFITSISPLSEKRYQRVIDQTKIDSISKDTTYTYKSKVVDSVIYAGDVVPNMVKHKAHQELTVEKKVPIYIEYFTCAVRNGVLVTYDDVYGYDGKLEEKYIKPLM